ARGYRRRGFRCRHGPGSCRACRPGGRWRCRRGLGTPILGAAEQPPGLLDRPSFLPALPMGERPLVSLTGRGIDRRRVADTVPVSLLERSRATASRAEAVVLLNL